MILNVFINSSSYYNSDIVSCSISGIEVARSNEIVTSEVTCADGAKLICVQAEIATSGNTDLDIIFNNYNNYAYVKSNSRLVTITNTLNTNRELIASNYDGRYPQVCANTAITVGNVGAEITNTQG